MCFFRLGGTRRRARGSAVTGSRGCDGGSGRRGQSARPILANRPVRGGCSVGKMVVGRRPPRRPISCRACVRAGRRGFRGKADARPAALRSRVEGRGGLVTPGAVAYAADVLLEKDGTEVSASAWSSAGRRAPGSSPLGSRMVSAMSGRAAATRLWRLGGVGDNRRGADLPRVRGVVVGDGQAGESHGSAQNDGVRQDDV